MSTDDVPPEHLPIAPLPEPDSLAAPPLGDDEPMSFERPRPRPGGVRDTLMETAAGRIESEAFERDTRALQEFARKFKSQHPSGYFEVRRTGPTQLPDSERGLLGKLKIADLRGKAIDDVLRAKYGGGEYAIVAKDPSHVAVPGGSFEVEIAGNIVPVSDEGEAWLTRRKPEGRAMDEARAVLDEARAVARGGGEQSVIGVMMQMMNNMTLQMREDRERREREENERRREEKEERDRKEKDERDRKEKREAAEKEERDRREKADREEREERNRRWEKQQKEDAAERDRRWQLQLKEMERRDAADLKRLELAQAGSLGISALKRIQEEVGELFVEQIRSKAGGGSDAPESWGDVARQVAADHGGPLLDKLLDVVREKFTAPPAAPGGVPTPPRRMIAAPQAPDPTAAEAIEPDVGDDAEPEAPAETPAAPATADGPAGTPQQAFKTQVAMGAGKAGARVAAFAAIVGSEIIAQGSPVAAWAAPQDDDGNTLTDVYDMLPAAAKAALRKGWRAFATIAAGNAPASVPHLQAIDVVLKRSPDAVTWMRTFIRSAPQDEADDDGSEAPTSDVAPGTPAPTMREEEPPSGEGSSMA